MRQTPITQKSRDELIIESLYWQTAWQQAQRAVKAMSQAIADSAIDFPAELLEYIAWLDEHGEEE